MAEYIEREAAKAAVKKRLGTMDLFESKFNAEIDAIPAADVAPKVNDAEGGREGGLGHVVHGRCDYCKDGRSFIGQTIMLANDGKCHTIHYCPNCGAKMDLEDEGGRE